MSAISFEYLISYGENNLSDQRLTFRKDLQGLRAIAVVFVILAHSGLSLIPGGFIGVDVFFVLSGYLITGLLLRELQQNARIDFMSFYSRRLKRLLPALALTLGITFCLAFVFLANEKSHGQLVSLPHVFFCLSNVGGHFKLSLY